MIIAAIVLAAAAAVFFVRIRLCANTLCRGFFEIKVKFGIILIWRGVFYLRVRSGKLPRLYRITKKKRMEIDIYRTRSPVESQNGLVQKVMPVSYTHLDVYKRQALNNLIDNAVKYTQEGGEVRVCVETVGTDAVVTVKDNGVGMSAEHLDKIFDRFYRVDKARARETGGTGLGLHLVQRIAHLHHGRVEVESRENAGSTFRLVIPLKQKTDGSEEG